MKWNKIDKKVVKETSLNRLLTKHTDNGYVMISACRHDWSEDHDENKEMNNIKTKELKSDISSAGYQYIPVQGGFIEDDGTEVVEQSFIIVNYKNRSNETADFDELKKLAISLCGKYNQDSVLVVAPGAKPQYLTRSGDVDMEFNDVSIRNNTEKYFTRIGGGRKFSFMAETTQPGTINGRRAREMKGEICVFA